jgi:uncharacterized protein YndB with AHSA1/START domain
MSIAPIVHTVQVKAPPARAFEIFTSRMHDWWLPGHSIGKNPPVAIVMESHAGGRWFERAADGVETQWGKVLAWEPPSRALLTWQINSQWAFDPDLVTEVELTFLPVAGGGTLVRLEHRNLERFGTDAEKHAASLNGGWPRLMGEFAKFIDAQS